MKLKFIILCVFVFSVTACSNSDTQIIDTRVEEKNVDNLIDENAAETPVNEVISDTSYDETTSDSFSDEAASGTLSDETVLIPVRKMIEAMENEDAEEIRAQFAKTATQAYGADGKMKSPESTTKWLESDIISRQGEVENPEFIVLSDKEVVVKWQYNSRGYTSKADFLFTVENGLITSWRMRY